MIDARFIEYKANSYKEEPESIQMAAGPSQTMTDAGPTRIELTGMATPDKTPKVGRAGVPYQTPSLKDAAAVGGAMLDMGASAVKGATQGFIGLPGDIEGIGRLILGKMGVNVDEATALPTTEEVKTWLDTNLGAVGDGKNPYESVGEVLAPGGQVKAAKAAATFSTGVLKGFKSVKPKEIPALFSHGTTEKSAQSIMESGKFDPATSNRQYSYSEFGLKASYLTPQEGWWLNSEKAQGGRAIVYDSAVDVKVDPKAKIVRIDSPEELHQLAKKSGFVDAYDMMKSLSVDSIEYAIDAQKATTSSLEEFSSFMKKRYPEFSGNPSDIADHYEEMKKLGQYFNEADNATKQLLDSGVDGIYISDKFSANLGPENYENWYPAGDQLAMFRQEMLKPVGKRSLKDSPSSTIPTSQQEPK